MTLIGSSLSSWPSAQCGRAALESEEIGRHSGTGILKWGVVCVRDFLEGRHYFRSGGLILRFLQYITIGAGTILKTKLLFQTQELHQRILRNSHHLSQPTRYTKDEHLQTMFYVIRGHQRPLIGIVTSVTLATIRYPVPQVQLAN